MNALLDANQWLQPAQTAGITPRLSKWNSGKRRMSNWMRPRSKYPLTFCSRFPQTRQINRLQTCQPKSTLRQPTPFPGLRNPGRMRLGLCRRNRRSRWGIELRGLQPHEHQWTVEKEMRDEGLMKMGAPEAGLRSTSEQS